MRKFVKNKTLYIYIYIVCACVAVLLYGINQGIFILLRDLIKCIAK